jgi:hypothetical protein
MFVADKAQGEVQTAEQVNRTLRLSEAIREGSKMIGESTHTLHDCTGCALGAAAVAAGIHHKNDFTNIGTLIPKLQAHFGTPNKVLMSASAMHFREEMTRAQVADWLESKGY